MAVQPFVSDMVGNHEDRFSHNEAQFANRQVWTNSKDPNKEQSDQDHHCLLFHLPHLEISQHNFNFRVFTVKLVDVQKLWNFMGYKKQM